MAERSVAGSATAGEPRSVAGGGGTGSVDPPLLAELQRALDAAPEGRRAIESRVAAIGERCGQRTYAELIHLLCDLRFEPAEAAVHWRRIVAHRAAMEARLGAPVDLRVSLVSYFLEVERKLHNPKVMELRAFERTRDSAYRDELTGLRNLRYLREFMAHELPRCRQYQKPVSLVMLDVDDFKHYNDRNGHEAGSRTLAEVARVLAGCVRGADLVARYGGEEFALVLPETPKPGAVRLGTRVCEAVARHPFTHAASQPLGRVTVSAGVATFPGDADGVEDLIRGADAALYDAKAAGKNTVRLCGDSQRSFRRYEASFGGSFRVAGERWHALVTRSVCQGGMLFRSPVALDDGTLLDLCVSLAEESAPVRLAARVLRSTPAGDAGHDVAIRFLDPSNEDGWRLRECLGALESAIRGSE